MASERRIWRTADGVPLVHPDEGAVQYTENGQATSGAVWAMLVPEQMEQVVAAARACGMEAEWWAKAQLLVQAIVDAPEWPVSDAKNRIVGWRPAPASWVRIRQAASDLMRGGA